ncbi:MAG: hypothetical protein OEV66_06215 [Spirochaetia bacterium]|nr:hypothetical protein [Spirochaetia bacterium]
MSHYSPMNLSIKKFIFIGLTEDQIQLIKSLKNEFNSLTDRFYWIFMQNTEDLACHLDQKTLIISHDARKAIVMETMHRMGHPLFLTWPDFLRFFHMLININLAPLERNVSLAFIPENYAKIYSTLMSLYGFNVSIIDQAIQLESALEAGIDYLVFDLDMNQLPEKKRLGLMQKIKYYCKQGLMANVIKNFDTGSLFNDILSPVKDISNLLLSPEEYAIFLRKYLYIKDLEGFEKNCYNLKGSSFFQEIAKKEKTMHIFSDLMDAKKKYHEIQSVRINSDQLEGFFLNGTVHLRFRLSEAVEDFINQHFDNSQRELFTFFPK